METNSTTSREYPLEHDKESTEMRHVSTYFNVGCRSDRQRSARSLILLDCIFLIPSQVIITRIRPSIWLPALEFIWGCLTLGIAFCKDYKQVYILRALIGVAESSAYPGTVTLLSE